MFHRVDTALTVSFAVVEPVTLVTRLRVISGSDCTDEALATSMPVHFEYGCYVGSSCPKTAARFVGNEAYETELQFPRSILRLSRWLRPAMHRPN